MDTLSTAIDWINHAGAMHWNIASAMFLQVTALVIVLGLVELFFRTRVRPVVRYWMWALVILKMMLPVTLGTPASVAYWFVKDSAPVASPATVPLNENRVPQPASSPEPDRPRDEMFEEAPRIAWEAPQIAARGSAPATRQSHASIVEPKVTPVLESVRKALPTLTARGWLLIAWLSGCVLLGVIVLRRAAKVRQLVARAGEAPRQLEAPLQVACELLNLSTRRIRLRISDEVGCPAVCGFWRPTILIPQRLINQLDDEQFELVFTHELIHWKRGDLQLNVLQTVLQIVYFYNPAVWIANSVVRRLREEAVDDAVLMATAAPMERYSNTLLDVASFSLRPVEANVPLIGILESRRAIVRRIYRLAQRPLPRSARLGIGGFVAVSLIAVALLPMAGRRRGVADKSAEKSTTALSGRITDETGRPVNDARLKLSQTGGGGVRRTRTAADGSYAFDFASKGGTYRLSIDSERCLGIDESDDDSEIDLMSGKPNVRNFSLQTACRLRVRTVDEAGQPIAGVKFVTAGPARFDPKGTDRQGWTTIGGLMPVEYVFAAEHEGRAVARLAVKLESARSVIERKLVLNHGTVVKGTVVTWDGKPAVGWQVVAAPTWWTFPGHPAGASIDGKGAFVLPQIGPGKYNLSLVIPGGRGGESTAPLISGVDLAHRADPLALRADFPSPGWQCAIEGNLRFVGGKARHPLRIFAESLDDYRFRDRATTRGEKYRLGPVPPGRYRLTFESDEIKTKVINSVVAPSTGLLVDVESYSPIPLHGVVSAGGEKSRPPLGEFLVRILKLSDPTAIQFASRRRWHQFDNPQGEFSGFLPGPGTYIVEATANGFATAQSKTFNADHVPKEGVHLTLLKYARLTGTVVDEKGRPIEGAVVFSLAKCEGHLPALFDSSAGYRGVPTVNGRFEFEGLAPGMDTFRIDHPDYVSSVVEKLPLRAEGQAPLTIVMKRGAAVSGHVRDSQGRPLEGVTLRFRRNHPEFAGDVGIQFVAKAVTDAQGYYEVHRLSEQLIQIERTVAGSSGVFCKCVLPSFAKTRTVDFGGPSSMSGQLFINGARAANTRLMRADEDFNSGAFAATALTGPDGSFVFSGVPEGRICLSYRAAVAKDSNEWNRVQTIDVHTPELNLGRIDHSVARLTVNVAGMISHRRDGQEVYLHDYNPTHFRRGFVARAKYPHAAGQPFVFENVGVGKYDVVAMAGTMRLNRMVEISRDDLNPAVTLEWPHGKASVRGTIDPKLRERSADGLIELASPDVRWSAQVSLKDEGRFEFAGIPAGPYSLTLLPVRLGTIVPLSLAEFVVHDAEAKTLKIAKENLPPAELKKGVLKVDLFTAEGIPLPGAVVALKSAAGLLQPNLFRGAHVFFVAPAGVYELSAAYPGSKTVTRSVEIKPIFEDSQWSAPSHNVAVTLAAVE